MLHDLSQYCPQKRMWYSWTSLPTISHVHHISGLPMIWAECLEDGASPPTDSLKQHIQKRPTLMASSNSHNDRSKATWVYDRQGTAQPLTISIKERLMGMEKEDTAALKATGVARHRMCGNAFPVAWIAHLLDLLIMKHEGTLRPLASRSLAEAVCVPSKPAVVLSALTDPQPASYIERLRSAAKRDSEYTKTLEAPPTHLQASNGLLFQKPIPNQ